MNQRLRHFSLLLQASHALGGCALTLVSAARHAKDVEELHAVGFTL